MKRPDVYDRHQIHSSEGGYYRYSAISGDEVIFVSEDDLWTVSIEGGMARRLTADKGQISSPAISPDGKLVAYTSTEQGCPEIFVMPVTGGTAEKLTFSGAIQAEVAGWSRDGQSVIIRSNLREPFVRRLALYQVPATGGEMEKMAVGDGHRIAYEPDGPGAVLVRYSDDLSRWKHYRGGTAGHLWIDVDGTGDWERLLPEITAGICRPMWIGDRIYFITDEEGSANVHSCSPGGEDLQRHTDHEGHYVRFASHDDTDIVYTLAGEIYHLDLGDDSVTKIEVDYPSSRPQLKPKFADASEYLQDYALHPDGRSLAVDTRGKVFSFGNWEGAVRQIGRRHGVRYRLPRYLGEGEQLLVVGDEEGEERFEVHDINGEQSFEILDTGDTDIGRPIDLVVSPSGDQAIFTNHQLQILHLDVNSGRCTLIDESPAEIISGMAWAPDSRHVAYGLNQTNSTSVIKIVDVQDFQIKTITSGDFCDTDPCFDPEGRYLYFLSYRHFAPIVEQLYFQVSMPNGVKPCVVTLREDVDSPFFEKPRPLDKSESKESDSTAEGTDDEDFSPSNPVRIDYEKMADRIEIFPVAEGRYDTIEATKDRVFWTVFAPPKEFTLDMQRRGTLKYFDLEKLKLKSFADKVSSFSIDRSAKSLVIDDGQDLRVVSASDDGPDTDDDTPGRDSGIIDLDRVAVGIEPRAEWCQMLREAWRLMRDHFWHHDMAGIDWEAIWQRYKSLLPRVSTRSEFSDLVWTMQGELGTSHAYEFGGDYEIPPQYQPGLLGADFRWDSSWKLKDAPERFDGGLRIERLLRGDPWDRKCSSPLRRPGISVNEGDVLLAINGQRLEQDTPVGQLLTNQIGREVELLIADAEGTEKPRTITVKTLPTEFPLRYRDWVELNRRTVHEATNNRIGYVHIPDMGLGGYAEFHRQYIREYDYDGLVVDVRFNGGGFVSQLILEKLARKPIGGSVKRHGSVPYTYPAHAVEGPMVALTSPEAGSDGDIFSHCFKQFELGPLIGKRTWGGTIGISPSHLLADGSLTTQPEYAIWFKDIGFGLENHGADPDIDVEYPPESSPGKKDPQLRVAIDEVLQLLEKTDFLKPATP